MKKILILFCALFCLSGAKAQEYRPLEEFGTDTIAYMQYNFIDRQEQYIGKPLSKILEDYELCLVVNSRTTDPFAPGADGKSWIFGTSIRYPLPPQSSKPFAMLWIQFKPPYLPWEETFQSMKNSDDDSEWAEKLKDRIVETIELAIGPFTPKN